MKQFKNNYYFKKDCNLPIIIESNNVTRNQDLDGSKTSLNYPNIENEEEKSAKVIQDPQ